MHFSGKQPAVLLDSIFSSELPPPEAQWLLVRLRRGFGETFFFLFQKEEWWQDPESNRGHKDFQSSALPTELSCQIADEKKLRNERPWASYLPVNTWKHKILK